MVTPSGGPRDNNPPTIINIHPPQKSTNISPQNITFQFDEFINVNNFADEVILNPFNRQPIQYKVKSKKLIVKLPDTLLKNKTYVINFRNAISDITEGNKLSNFTYVFSTGQNIDSMIIRGKVYDAISGEPEKNFHVFLYEKYNDSLPFNAYPDYLTKTDEYGDFEFTNLEKKYYKILGIKDNNGNFIFDIGEKIAFSDTLICALEPELSKQRKNKIQLYSFQEEPTKQDITKSILQDSKITLIFKKSAENLKIDCLTKLSDGQEIIRENSYSKDTVYLWLKNIYNIKDSLSLILKDDNNFADTLHFSLKPQIKSIRDERISTVKERFSLTTNLNSGNILDFNKNLTLTFARPIQEHKNEKILLLSEKDTIKTKITWLDSIKRILVISFDKQVNRKFKLILPKNTFKDFGGYENDSLNINFSIPELKSYGTLILNITYNTNNKPLLIITDEKNNIITQTKITQNNLKIEYLWPGKYKMKVIMDNNENLRWDTGNYIKKIQPEKTYVYQGEILIKSNWDTEINWNIEN